MTDEPREVLEPTRRLFLLGRFLGPEPGGEVTRALGPRPPCLPAGAWTSESPCLDCPGPCVAACEPAIVRRHGAEHALAGDAYLDFSERGCTTCGDCLRACPACDAATTPPRRIGLASLDAATCMAWQGVICRSCAFACPERAISWDSRRRPGIVADRCNGCGLCLPVCPASCLAVLED